MAGYLAWRPQTGTSLGLHAIRWQGDRLPPGLAHGRAGATQTFDQRLGQLDTNRLSPEAFYDYRILRSSIQREIFGFEQMRIYSDNPMTYAGALDVNIYIKRDFAPLEERVRSVVAILNQAPQIMAAARANLAESLPRPQVETAIEEAEGTADFLAKDLVAALKDVKNETLMAGFNAANQRAIERDARLCGLPQGTEAAQGQRPLRARAARNTGSCWNTARWSRSPRSNCWTSACANCSASSRCLPKRPGKLIPPGAHRGLPRHPERPSHRAEPDPRHGEGPGHDPAVRDRPPDHHHSFAGPRDRWRRLRNSCAPPASPRWTRPGRLKPRPPRPTTTSRRWKPIGRRSKRRSG